MSGTKQGVIYALILAILIFATDLIFFRHHAGARLAANIGIVLLFGAFYFRYFR
mgnify:CR=1 FL=1